MVSFSSRWDSILIKRMFRNRSRSSFTPSRTTLLRAFSSSVFLGALFFLSGLASSTLDSSLASGSGSLASGSASFGFLSFSFLSANVATSVISLSDSSTALRPASLIAVLTVSAFRSPMASLTTACCFVRSTPRKDNNGVNPPMILLTSFCKANCCAGSVLCALSASLK